MGHPKCDTLILFPWLGAKRQVVKGLSWREKRPSNWRGIRGGVLPLGGAPARDLASWDLSPATRASCLAGMDPSLSAQRPLGPCPVQQGRVPGVVLGGLAVWGPTLGGSQPGGSWWAPRPTFTGVALGVAKGLRFRRRGMGGPRPSTSARGGARSVLSSPKRLKRGPWDKAGHFPPFVVVS